MSLHPHTFDIIASGAHDTKNALFNALARVDIALEALRASDTQSGEKQKATRNLKDARRYIEHSAERLTKLLSVFRVDSSETPTTLLPVFLPDFVEDVLVRTREIEEGGLSLLAECNYADVWVFDRDLIADCIVNALQNAARFARSRILLSVCVVGERLCLQVEDDGPGYPESLLPDNLRTGYDDCGIGLYLAQRIAALHWRKERTGKLILGRSESLGGARFLLELP